MELKNKKIHHILNCNSYFRSPVKMKLANCPIKKANSKKKKVYLMKNISCTETQHRAALGRDISHGTSQKSHHFNFTPSKYFSILNLPQKI